MRTTMACAVVAVVCLFAAMDYYRKTSTRNEQRPDFYRVGYQEERFRPVAAMVPESEVMGYVSNLDFDTTAGGAAFSGAQFVLAPRLVVGFDDPVAGEYTLGNFSAEAETSDVTSDFTRNRNARVVRDFDAGVVEFSEQATITEGGNQISSNYLVYNIREQRIKAQSGGEGDPKVRITYTPAPTTAPGEIDQQDSDAGDAAETDVDVADQDDVNVPEANGVFFP